MTQLQSAIAKTTLFVAISMKASIALSQNIYISFPVTAAALQYAVDSNHANLVSFTAEQVKDKVHIAWSANQDEQVSHYSIERSYDNRNFDMAAIVFTSDIPASLNNYAFKDAIRHDAGTVIYYRLKIIDKNGSFKYSDIRNITRAK